MADSFSLAGTLRLVPSWVDALTATTVTDTATINVPLTLTDGTGTGQANCYWKDVRTISASGSDTVDLTALPVKAYGGQATVSLDPIRLIYVRNRSTVQSLEYITLGGEIFSIVPLGVFVWVAPTTPGAYPVGDWSSNREIQMRNDGAVSADYEIVLVGVKT